MWGGGWAILEANELCPFAFVQEHKSYKMEAIVEEIVSPEDLKVNITCTGVLCDTHDLDGVSSDQSLDWLDSRIVVLASPGSSTPQID